MATKVGLISDTHGLLRPQAVDALRGCDHLIHGGDIGKPEILDALRNIAPLTVVRGNNDTDDAWAASVPFEATVRVGSVGIYVTHILADVPETLPPDIGVVVTGHSHKPLQALRHGVLFINPGSAGPRRFKLPITVGILHIDGLAVRGELVELDLT
ncbi:MULTISPECIES: metallophosphoesterase family protein [unclassified Pseudomonas]|uniref:metallophosphoesterase family protein n=1 Tax=unclassified Pseudomonas TaxID=196821 RepID=UPI000D3B3F5E|nr:MULTISPECIES: metallophosphoesterase family protein [unclassified Pseudomonas]RAU44807.1 metallophosphoesterase [Pseudomonas sp. RIT 409]RAU53622.1 metallophosphoesterase [Pseudomonas sp. RIT 412]